MNAVIEEVAPEWRVWLREFVELFEDNSKAALEALTSLSVSGEALDLLTPIVAEACLILRRQGTRRVERQVAVVDLFQGPSTVEARRERLVASFALPDGHRVGWGDATEADHVARVGMLRLHVVGVEATIAEHEAAIVLIRKHRVTCLNEIV